MLLIGDVLSYRLGYTIDAWSYCNDNTI